MPEPYTRSTDLPPVHDWLLDVKTYAVTQGISPFLLETLDAQALRRAAFDTLLIRLQAQVVTRDTRAYDVTAHDRVPASWWDHYKHTLWAAVADRPGWQAAADRWTFRRLRLDRVRYVTTTVTLHVQEFAAYPDADPALAATLGPGVPKRIVTGPTWPVRFDDTPSPIGDTDDH